MILVRATCSYESNIETANSRKNLKYQDVKRDLEAQHYTVTLLPYEVGSRNRTALESLFRTNKIKVKTGQLFKKHVQNCLIVLIFNFPCKRTANMAKSPIFFSLVDPLALRPHGLIL